MPKRVKIHGERGRWVAEVEGTWLAVIHHTHRVGMTNHFQPFDRGDPRGSARYVEFETALRATDLVVIQRDKDPVKLDRDGYIGVFRFKDLVIDYERGITMTFIEKYADPKQS